jgi:hypothetical protein
VKDLTTPVFVHLGDSLPRHLQSNLARSLKLFPERVPILVTNRGCKISRRLKKSLVVIEYVDDEWFLGHKKYHNGDFRKGFWQLTLNRIYVLALIHRKYQVPILHIESDVLLMKDFPWNKFDIFEKIAWLNVSIDHDIAALLFSPSAVLTEHLVEELKICVDRDPNKTDMTSMIEVTKILEDNFSYLPSCPPEWSRFSTPEKGFENSKALEEYFGGYFDPAALGIWNLGQDPRNHFGRSRIHIDPNTHKIDPSKVKLSIEGGHHLHDQYGNKVFSLHVHSKNNRLFKSKSGKYLEQLLGLSSQKQTHSKFYWSKFVLSLFDYPFPKNIWVLINSTKISKRTAAQKILAGTKKMYEKFSH